MYTLIYYTWNKDSNLSARKTEKYQELKNVHNRIDFLNRHIDMKGMEIWDGNKRVSLDGSIWDKK